MLFSSEMQGMQQMQLWAAAVPRRLRLGLEQEPQQGAPAAMQALAEWQNLAQMQFLARGVAQAGLLAELLVELQAIRLASPLQVAAVAGNDTRYLHHWSRECFGMCLFNRY